MQTNTLDYDTLHALWAAMQAMVNDVHSPQDNLTPQQWVAAAAALSRLDAEVNARRS